MGNVIGIGKVAGDPRVCGIPRPISAVRAEERRASESVAASIRSNEMGGRKLEDPGHNRSGCNVIDSGRVRSAIKFFEESEGSSRLRRAGIIALAIWCITSTALAIIMLASISELEQVIEKLNSEVKAAQTAQSE